MNKPYSASCKQNQTAILDIIKPLLEDKSSVLEIGSGTGQHAVYFAKAMPHLEWQTSDQTHYHSGIQAWIDDSMATNIKSPIALNVSTDSWPKQTYDMLFTANTLHIMSQHDVISLYHNIAHCMNNDASFVVYGPFNYHGKYTSKSNQQFDNWLRSQNNNSGIKDFEWVNQLAEKAELKLITDYDMPANNRILHWKKIN